MAAKRTWVNAGATTVTIDGKAIAPGDTWKGDPPRLLVRNGSLRRKPRERKPTT